VEGGIESGDIGGHENKRVGGFLDRVGWSREALERVYVVFMFAGLILKRNVSTFTSWR
jgi:hypothetical protein